LTVKCSKSGYGSKKIVSFEINTLIMKKIFILLIVASSFVACKKKTTTPTTTPSTNTNNPFDTTNNTNSNVATITGFGCDSLKITGTLIKNQQAFNVHATITYTGGNGKTYNSI